MIAPTPKACGTGAIGVPVGSDMVTMEPLMGVIVPLPPITLSETDATVSRPVSEEGVPPISITPGGSLNVEKNVPDDQLVPLVTPVTFKTLGSYRISNFRAASRKESALNMTGMVKEAPTEEAARGAFVVEPRSTSTVVDGARLQKYVELAVTDVPVALAVSVTVV